MEESNIVKASQIRRTIEGLMASKTEIQAHYATLGVGDLSFGPLIWTLDQQISTLQNELRGIDDGREIGSLPIELQYVHIVVRDMDGVMTPFNVKRHTLIERLLSAWCTRQSKPRWDFEFYFKGFKLLPNHTVQELRMEDGDVIHVLEHKAGCSCDLKGYRVTVCLG